MPFQFWNPMNIHKNISIHFPSPPKSSKSSENTISTIKTERDKNVNVFISAFLKKSLNFQHRSTLIRQNDQALLEEWNFPQESGYTRSFTWRPRCSTEWTPTATRPMRCRCITCFHPFLKTQTEFCGKCCKACCKAWRKSSKPWLHIRELINVAF